MLYSSNPNNQKIDKYIFEAEPFNDDIDIRDVAETQAFYEQNGYIKEEHVLDLLNWIVYRCRINICTGMESPLFSSFAGRCSRAQAFNASLCSKLGFEVISFNIGDVIGTTKIHALCCVQIPVEKDGEMTHKLFMLDPTFRQFWLEEENRFERYYEEPRWGVKMSCPHPGYFFNLTDTGKQFATDLIHFGFFEVSEDTLKTYFDPFVLYTTPKEEYEDIADIGNISNTSNEGIDYWQAIVDNIESPFGSTREFDLNTPIEIISMEDRQLLNRLKNIFPSKKELSSENKKNR